MSDNVPDATSNGLMVTDVFPWTEGFEGRFQNCPMYMLLQGQVPRPRGNATISPDMLVPEVCTCLRNLRPWPNTNDVLLGNLPERTATSDLSVEGFHKQLCPLRLEHLTTAVHRPLQQYLLRRALGDLAIE